MPDYREEFARIVEAADRTLWAAYLISTGKAQPVPGVQLRFPRYRSGASAKVRVSEQEARFALTGELSRSALLFCVETPTSQAYQFTGTLGLSAQSDVTAYSPAGEPLWNIEFKAHGFSPDRKGKLSVQKDIEKLLCEPTPGFWFHTFEAVNNSTLSQTWAAFVGDVRDVVRKHRDRIHNTQLLFHACVLRQQFSVEQTIVIDTSQPETGCVIEVPRPVYKVTRDSLTSFQVADGWKLRREIPVAGS